MPGYRLNIDENQIGKHLLCTLCCLLLRAPVQTVCGHRCCLSCVKEKRGSSDSFFCPDDGTEVTEVYPDRFVEREILNLQVTCINKCSGCTWNGAVKDYEVHFDTCQFVNSLCPNEGCVVTIARHALEKHMQNECKFRPINCPACDELIQFNFLKKHQQTICPGTKVKCSQCGKDVLRGQLSSHQESECDEALVPCPFVKIGCAAKRPMKKNDKRKHMENAQSNHMTYLLNYSLELGSKAAAIEGALVQGKDTTYEEMEYDTETETAMKMGKLAVRELSVKKKGKNVPDSCPMAGPSQKHDLTSLPPDMASIRDAAFWDSSKSKEIDTQVSNLDSRITAMSLQIDDRYQELVDEIGKMNRNIDAVRDLCRKFESKFTANADWQQRTDVNMADQSDRIENVEFASYNGVIIWPIAEFMRKRHDSIVGKNVSFYSPYFYTGRYGYKMRLRVYLNGDGIGKGSHFSLFFVICKGKYDALLPWPFRQKVTMTILDQDNVQNVSDSFKPDPSSSSFQRPKNPMNIASGCPLFMPLAYLDTQAYLRDDSLFIKAEVDTSNLPHSY